MKLKTIRPTKKLISSWLKRSSSLQTSAIGKRHSKYIYFIYMSIDRHQTDLMARCIALHQAQLPHEKVTIIQ